MCKISDEIREEGRKEGREETMHRRGAREA